MNDNNVQSMYTVCSCTLRMSYMYQQSTYVTVYDVLFSKSHYTYSRLCSHTHILLLVIRTNVHVRGISSLDVQIRTCDTVVLSVLCTYIHPGQASIISSVYHTILQMCS